MKINIPITERDVTVLKRKKKNLVIIDNKKFEALLKYCENLQDELIFSRFEKQEQKVEQAFLDALSEMTKELLKQKKTIYERICIMMAHRALSIKKLANLTGIPYTTLHRTVTTDANSKINIITKISKALRTPVGILIRGVKE